MNIYKAKTILADHLRVYRRRSYVELLPLLRGPETSEFASTGGETYQLEFQAFWDDRKGGNLRVIGSIDDGGFRVFVPLSDDFIVAPDGSFVGE